jgi:hypothetical protein
MTLSPCELVQVADWIVEGSAFARGVKGEASASAPNDMHNSIF